MSKGGYSIVPRPALLNAIIDQIGGGWSGPHPYRYASNSTDSGLEWGYVHKASIRCEDEFYTAIVTIEVHPRPKDRE